MSTDSGGANDRKSDSNPVRNKDDRLIAYTAAYIGE